MSNPTPVQTITADSFETEIQLALPNLDKNELAKTVQIWIDKNRKYWPSELTAEKIVKGVPLIHLPYWAVSGQGTATWYASIGVDREVLKRCGTCGGRGRHTPIYSTDERRCDRCAGSGKELGKETFWNNQSGHAEADFDGVLVDNYDEKSLQLQIGKRDFKVDWRIAPNAEKTSTVFVAPIATTKAAAKQTAEKT